MESIIEEIEGIKEFNRLKNEKVKLPVYYLRSWVVISLNKLTSSVVPSLVQNNKYVDKNNTAMVCSLVAELFLYAKVDYNTMCIYTKSNKLMCEFLLTPDKTYYIDDAIKKSVLYTTDSLI